MDIKNEALKYHKELGGKIEVVCRASINTKDDLSLCYTPGVAEPCLKIWQEPDLSYTYTRRHNLVAVVTDGSAVLGLGNIGPLASMPVMEGKCALLKRFADVDAIPICVSTQNVDEFVFTVKNIAKSFGGILLEDISAPRCFEIEQKLKDALDIPVFHDDQHGTAIVVFAGLINAFKLADKPLSLSRIVILGAGAAGCAIAKLLIRYGAKNIVLVDKDGIIFEGKEGLNKVHSELSALTNPHRLKGDLTHAMNGADAFVGVAAANLVNAEMVTSMSKKSIVFAMSNPNPEIDLSEAKKAGAFIVGSGRSDFDNQINNILAFPGVFRGALDCRAKAISENMKLAAALALANATIPTVECVLPRPLGADVAGIVAKSVKEAAIKEKLNRI